MYDIMTYNKRYISDPHLVSGTELKTLGISKIRRMMKVVNIHNKLL